MAVAAAQLRRAVGAPPTSGPSPSLPLTLAPIPASVSINPPAAHVRDTPHIACARALAERFSARAQFGARAARAERDINPARARLAPNPARAASIESVFLSASRKGGEMKMISFHKVQKLLR